MFSYFAASSACFYVTNFLNNLKINYRKLANSVEFEVIILVIYKHIIIHPRTTGN